MGAAGLEPPMDEKKLSLKVVPEIEGADELVRILKEADNAVLCALDLLQKAKGATLDVTLFEGGEPVSSRE